MKLGFPLPMLTKGPIMVKTASKSQMAITTPTAILNDATFLPVHTPKSVQIAIAYIQNAVIQN